METNSRVGVFIGRMQPPHAGHISVIKKMVEENDEIIILFGSSLSVRDSKNPFTWRERATMVITELEAQFTLVSEEYYYSDESCEQYMVDNKRVVFYPLRDYPYSNSRWQYQVQHIVEGDVPGDNTVTLYGNNKDESSFYLKLFPRWNRAETQIVPVGDQFYKHALSSTMIREQVLGGFADTISEEIICEANINWLNSWTHSPQGQKIIEEKQWVDNFKKPYKDLPYGIIFQTVDCLITWRGLVLLGKRRSMPGKDLWAIPGGYVNQGERLEDAAIRELVEETRTRVYMNTKSGRKRLRFDPSWIVSSRTFDHPSRSRRGRIITTAYHWKIPDHYEILHEADDDLQKTQFFPVNHVLDNMNLQMFEDHQHIVANMLLRH